MLTTRHDRDRTISRHSFFTTQGRHNKTGFWLVPAVAFLFLASFACTAWAQNIVVDVTPSHVTNTIRPSEAVGA